MCVCGCGRVRVRPCQFLGGRKEHCAGRSVFLGGRRACNDSTPMGYNISFLFLYFFPAKTAYGRLIKSLALQIAALHWLQLRE